VPSGKRVTRCPPVGGPSTLLKSCQVCSADLMIKPLLTRWSGVLWWILVGLVLAGCGSAGHGLGTGMMGAGSGSAGLGAGSQMMDGGSGYHHSRLNCAAPNSLPGRIVRVTLADMGMTQMMSGTAPIGSHMMLKATPNAVPAGQISLVASNLGWRTHELVILPLGAGGTAGHRIPGADGKIAETGSLGEASGSCAGGAGDGIKAGQVGWTSAILAPGRYELVCNLENHYAAGMRQQLVVH